MKFFTTAVSAALLLVCSVLDPAAAADISSSAWTETAAGNSAGPPHGFPEQMNPSSVNDSAREIMAALKREHDRSHPTKTSGGSGNAQTLTYSVPPTACVKGDAYAFFAGFTNTGATTLNNGACTAPIKKGTANLAAGDIVTAQVVLVFYDGTNFQLLSGGGGSSSGTSLIALNGTGCLELNGGGCLELNGP